MSMGERGRAGAGSRPDETKNKTRVIRFRCSPPWGEWFDGFMAHTGLSASELIASSVARHAKARGYPLPPRR